MSTGTGLERFSINQMTVKQLSLPELVDGCTELGIPGVGLWREPVAEYGLEATAKLVRDAGLAVTTLCRGGFFTAIDPAERAAALADNRKAIDEAATLGTDTLVLVSGGLPSGSKDLHGARERIADALSELGPYAAANGVRLAIEPLHPMFASDRCVVSTLSQALDIAERFPAEQVGVTVDTYHIWWDDTAPAAIARAGATGRIHTFQLADWITPLPQGVLTGRGQIGDGAIDMREWKAYVEAAGYTGPIEVELFNDELWAGDGRALLAQTARRFVEHAA
ncbi:sugar phosphate isomerase/epimerase [Streptomyces sp. LBUM 1478]|uniref:Xylose isomerase-like TIM barrel domain-containing protein n=2 Tax=Streptomyces TaxID=1883 RepID=C9Z4B2_STRSW|nr:MULTISPECIES: sugar phosphate isomerase/epimerase family protein [Streptomyces]MBP5867446.1 sugar phosphate isomerase/epimerase [Streptomyces sp. LBUM 1485]MBP5906067.1 sugar phosphate isomerase/epimerase [Streptomyces sp. LBUM 1478]MBP5931379.1 sugar phosphate isomerase/epimerase [Streptomyces sp. LBUM 1479]MBP5875914.1 sugar phosphate isomerase/epimerase [Streptomyces sp. LBUM 1477]MBP5883634.1 sugar phosphate isomerase/epimerase [Streptomyces sp. LBUM 1487]